MNVPVSMKLDEWNRVLGAAAVGISVPMFDSDIDIPKIEIKTTLEAIQKLQHKLSVLNGAMNSSSRTIREG